LFALNDLGHENSDVRPHPHDRCVRAHCASRCVDQGGYPGSAYLNRCGQPPPCFLSCFPPFFARPGGVPPWPEGTVALGAVAVVVADVVTVTVVGRVWVV
jgi:hypothetical protein